MLPLKELGKERPSGITNQFLREASGEHATVSTSSQRCCDARIVMPRRRLHNGVVRGRAVASLSLGLQEFALPSSAPAGVADALKARAGRMFAMDGLERGVCGPPTTRVVQTALPSLKPLRSK